jgi:hypothetical protein
MINYEGGLFELSILFPDCREKYLETSIANLISSRKIQSVKSIINFAVLMNINSCMCNSS